MPKRHAGSHALATFVSMIAGTVLATWLRFQYHSIIGVFDRFSKWVLQSIMPLDMSQEVLTNILFATVISAIWGLGFYFMKRT